MNELAERPGPRERHLRRRQGNPLFPEARRQVSPPDWISARRADAEELEGFVTTFQALVGEAAALEAKSESEQVLDLKARLEQAYEQCAGLGGDVTELKGALRTLLDLVMQAIARGAQGDALAVAELQREALARSAHFELLEEPLVADLLRPDSPIEQDELVPVLLSTTQQALQAVLHLFDAAQLEALCAEGRALLATLQGQGQGLTLEEPQARLAWMESKREGRGSDAQLN